VCDHAKGAVCYFLSPNFRLNVDSSSMNARDALAAAIALDSAKFEKVGFEALSCWALLFGIAGLPTTGSFAGNAMRD